ncbi:MAG TPA: hypothetical protein VFY06_08260 [Verrucomicrobiae bacterium]|nr:hypothetical protein [Verrucomicrobiae bacterium]
MKPASIRFNVWKILTIIAVLAATAAAPGQPADSTVPIKFENVPITTAINTLARLCGLNYILDSKLSGSFLDADGKPVPEPMVSISSTDLTAKEALTKLLKEHGLRLIDNPDTSITVIGYPNRIVNPVDASLLGGDTNQLGRIVFHDVPLDEALKNLVQKAHINATLDSTLPSHSDPAGKFHPAPSVSVHWENVTARQAIIALCENYHLAIVKDSTTGTICIKPRD